MSTETETETAAERKARLDRRSQQMQQSIEDRHSAHVTDEEIDALRTIMQRDFGVTDTPLHREGDPDRPHRIFSIAARSSRTRREILDALPDADRARLLEQLAAGPEVDLDSPEVVEVRLHSWSAGAGLAQAATYERWLRDVLLTGMPAGYVPIGSWQDWASPMDQVRRAKTVADEAPAGLSAAVRGALQRGISATMIAAELGVSRSRVYQIRDGKR